MVNDEMLKKLKDQYIGVEVPDDEKNKLNEILEYAKIDRKRKRKKQKKDEKIRRKEMRRQDAPDRKGPFWRAFLPM